MSVSPIQQAFLRALARGELIVVRNLVAQGADVDLASGGPGGETPLIRAISCGDLNAVQLLIELNADVNLRQSDVKGWTPLMFAYNSAAISRELVQAGADVNARGTSYIANAKNSHEKIRCGGETALHLAAAVNNAETVALLIEAGAEIESLSESGVAPLALALCFGSMTSTAEALIRAGAKLTPERIDLMHSAAHTSDSDLAHFPWTLGKSGPERVTPRPVNSGPNLPPPISYGDLKCPQCGSPLYSRRPKFCGKCGAALPAELVVTDEQLRAMQQQRQWARDLAESLLSGRSSRATEGERLASDKKMLSLPPQELLDRHDYAEEFRNRRRIGFPLYVIAYTLMLGTILWIWKITPAIPVAAVLVLVALLALSCYVAWQRTNPICPSCHQNVRTCMAVFCHGCGKHLVARRCARCSVDQSWFGFILRAPGNFRSIDYCPGCGVWLGTRIPRWYVSR